MSDLKPDRQRRDLHKSNLPATSRKIGPVLITIGSNQLQINVPHCAKLCFMPLLQIGDMAGDTNYYCFINIDFHDEYYSEPVSTPKCSNPYAYVYASFPKTHHVSKKVHN
jgi:hypothetical protein